MVYSGLPRTRSNPLLLAEIRCALSRHSFRSASMIPFCRLALIAANITIVRRAGLSLLELYSALAQDVLVTFL
jgi:hypothetical protein